MKTVRVRIAVSVDPDGVWNSCGWSEGSDADKSGLAFEEQAYGGALHWVEADVPIPEPTTIEGEVTT